MTPGQYQKKPLPRSGCRRLAAARFLRIAERTSRCYIAGEAIIPPPTGMLLNLMVDLKISPEQARKKYSAST